MEHLDYDPRMPFKIGDRTTSDVVVRLRTQEGRDDWIYCHSNVLIKNSKYFADRLSDNWPTCQILDSRNCVEVFCEEADLDYHVNNLRLLYTIVDGSDVDICHGVRNALGILQVANELGCPQIISASVAYIEAMPWEESEEEEILKIIPKMGIQAEPILSRLQPVNTSAVVNVFLSALRFATSSPCTSLSDLKNSAQEQLEYMLTEDDDAPILTVNDEIKSVVHECVKSLISRFNNLLEDILSEHKEFVSEPTKLEFLYPYLFDLSWTCQILAKMDLMRDLVLSWVDTSETILKVIEIASTEIEILERKIKVIEITAKVLEAIGLGSVILPTLKRLQMVRIWLPFARITKHMIDFAPVEGEDDHIVKVDSDVWQSLESAFVSIILALPSTDQAEILNEWLKDKHVRYPDLTEAFEVWCYRSKVAKRRLTSLGLLEVTKSGNN